MSVAGAEPNDWPSSAESVEVWLRYLGTRGTGVLAALSRDNDKTGADAEETMHAKTRQLCLYRIRQQAAVVNVIVANGFDATHNALRLDPAGNPFVL